MYGLNTTGDFDQYSIANMSGFGQNDEGDFSQYSIHGVDFGEDYTKDHGVEPVNNEGETYMQANHYDGVGIMPESVVGNPITPEGLQGYEQQMGIKPEISANPVVPEGMGTIPQGLGGIVEDVQSWMTSSTNIPVVNAQVPNWALAGVAGVGAWWLMFGRRGGGLF